MDQKNKDIIAYSITKENNVLEIANLPHYSSVFSAEIIAIYKAVTTVKYQPGKYVICSDSLSSLQAIQNLNNNDYYPFLIRSILTTHYPKVILIWVPSHVNIRGNEVADSAAKFAVQAPLHTTCNYNILDI